MNRTLYGNLIFELSKKGRKGYSLPQDYDRTHTQPLNFPQHFVARKLPACLSAMN